MWIQTPYPDQILLGEGMRFLTALAVFVALTFRVTFTLMCDSPRAHTSYNIGAVYHYWTSKVTLSSVCSVYANVNSSTIHSVDCQRNSACGTQKPRSKTFYSEKFSHSTHRESSRVDSQRLARNDNSFLSGIPSTFSTPCDILDTLTARRPWCANYDKSLHTHVCQWSTVYIRPAAAERRPLPAVGRVGVSLNPLNYSHGQQEVRHDIVTTDKSVWC